MELTANWFITSSEEMIYLLIILATFIIAIFINNFLTYKAKSSEEITKEDNISVEEMSEQLEETIECQTEYQSLSKEEMPMKSMSRVYARDSMERFGDDLTELILSYLLFTDKLRLECVSKQWRRLVYNKQVELNMTYFRTSYFNVDRQTLESVLKKCPNIEKVIFFNNFKGFDFQVMTKNSRRVSALRIMMCCEDVLLWFVSEITQWLNGFTKDNINDPLPNNFKYFLQICPDIERINFGERSYYSIYFDGSDSVKNLQVNKKVIIRSNEPHIFWITWSQSMAQVFGC